MSKNNISTYLKPKTLLEPDMATNLFINITDDKVKGLTRRRGYLIKNPTVIKEAIEVFKQSKIHTLALLSDTSGNIFYDKDIAGDYRNHQPINTLENFLDTLEINKELVLHIAVRTDQETEALTVKTVKLFNENSKYNFGGHRALIALSHNMKEIEALHYRRSEEAVKLRCLVEDCVSWHLFALIAGILKEEVTTEVIEKISDDAQVTVSTRYLSIFTLLGLAVLGGVVELAKQRPACWEIINQFAPSDENGAATDADVALRDLTKDLHKIDALAESADKLELWADVIELLHKWHYILILCLPRVGGCDSHGDIAQYALAYTALEAGHSTALEIDALDCEITHSERGRMEQLYAEGYIICNTICGDYETLRKFITSERLEPLCKATALHIHLDMYGQLNAYGCALRFTDRTRLTGMLAEVTDYETEHDDGLGTFLTGHDTLVITGEDVPLILGIDDEVVNLHVDALTTNDLYDPRALNDKRMGMYSIRRVVKLKLFGYDDSYSVIDIHDVEHWHKLGEGRIVLDDYCCTHVLAHSDEGETICIVPKLSSECTIYPEIGTDKKYKAPGAICGGIALAFSNLDELSRQVREACKAAREYRHFIVNKNATYDPRRIRDTLEYKRTTFINIVKQLEKVLDKDLSRVLGYKNYVFEVSRLTSKATLTDESHATELAVPYLVSLILYDDARLVNNAISDTYQYGGYDEIEIARPIWRDLRNKVIEALNAKEASKRAEKERMLAEQRAERERILAEQRAERERILAEKKAEQERLEAERIAEQERIRAEQEALQRKREEEERAKREAEEAELAELQAEIDKLEKEETEQREAEARKAAEQEEQRLKIEAAAYEANYVRLQLERKENAKRNDKKYDDIVAGKKVLRNIGHEDSDKPMISWFEASAMYPDEIPWKSAFVNNIKDQMAESLEELPDVAKVIEDIIEEAYLIHLDDIEDPITGETIKAKKRTNGKGHKTGKQILVKKYGTTEESYNAWIKAGYRPRVATGVAPSVLKWLAKKFEADYCVYNLDGTYSMFKKDNIVVVDSETIKQVLKAGGKF